ncbi:MAG: response regulator [Lachnospiraceae bacterium]|nr:response regulator [Lachnospiraceae bacterium]
MEERQLSEEFLLTKDNFPIIKQMASVMPGGFFFYKEDEEREILYVNHVVLSIFGCETEEEFKELTGNTFEGMVHPEDFRKVQDSIDKQIASSDKNLDHVQYRITRKDGKIRWVDDYGRFSHSDDFGDIYYVFISDITEKHEAIRLERELRANEAKNAFLFNISHDIRTPMNSIIGFTRLAMEHIDKKDVLMDYLKKVDASSSHMLGLIDDILEMSVIDSGQIELHPTTCGLREEILTVVNLLELEAKKRSQTIEMDVPEQQIEVDALRFRRILSNLLGNALKFSPDGGKVSISARCLTMTDNGYGRYEIQVKDNGIGMSKNFQQRIFDAFEREETSTQSGITGTGIGLTIVKGILDAMGGSISVESKKNQGSTFTIQIPVKVVDNERAQLLLKPRINREANKNRRILLVDDVGLNRKLAQLILMDSGFQVDSACDGSQAVDAVASHPVGYYDLVLMDIQMPVMDGYEASMAIRALHRKDTENLPILALSANNMEEDRRRSIESGMNRHIQKPFDSRKLVAIIQSYLDGHPEDTENL